MSETEKDKVDPGCDERNGQSESNDTLQEIDNNSSLLNHIYNLAYPMEKENIKPMESPSCENNIDHIGAYKPGSYIGYDAVNMPWGLVYPEFPTYACAPFTPNPMDFYQQNPRLHYPVPCYYPHLLSCISPPTSPVTKLCDGNSSGLTFLYDERSSCSSLELERSTLSDAVVPGHSFNNSYNSLSSLSSTLHNVSTDNTSCSLSDSTFEDRTSSFQPVRPWATSKNDSKNTDISISSDNSLNMSNGSGLAEMANSERERPSKKRKFDAVDSDKPNISYIEMIAQAILSTKDKKMVLCDIYDYIRNHFPYYDNEQRAWRNSVRHNLSINECFIKKGRDGRGNFWAIHPNCYEEFAKGNCDRKLARGLCRVSAPNAKNRSFGSTNAKLSHPLSGLHLPLNVPANRNHRQEPTQDGVPVQQFNPSVYYNNAHFYH